MIPTPSTRLAAALWLAWGTACLGQTTPAPASDGEVAATTRRILAEIDEDSELMANLEYLCDHIGPRLTGSPALEEAGAWVRGKFAEYGLENVHREGWTIERAWTRGEAAGRLVAPVERRLAIESAGWSRATPGPVRGPVVYALGDGPEDVAAYRGKLRGAWILLEPHEVYLSAEREARLTEEQKQGEPSPADAPGYEAFYRGFEALMIAEGAAGMLVDSARAHGLLYMSGGASFFTGSLSRYRPTPLPVAYLAGESYGLIWRLRKQGPVEVEIDLPNRFSPGPVEVSNTVAELVGVDRPEEVVILGAHLDSWDLGSGATDDGTGCMAILEAARALRAAEARPRRTIRFVLFAGEEQRKQGSRAYVRAHAAELRRISAMLNIDMGTGRVRTLTLQGRDDLAPLLRRVIAPFREALGLEDLSPRLTHGSDHVPFREAGVPAFTVWQHLDEYGKSHHTQADTFDKVYAEEIHQASQVLAGWAYNVAMLPECLPRAPRPAPLRAGF